MEFRILGPLEVWDEGGEVSLGGRKPRALLAVLLLHPNEVVSADRLIDELWGEDSPERAAAALRVNVSRLRKTLPQDVLTTRSPGYVIRVEPDEFDLHRFERLVDEGRSLLTRGLAADASERLRDALSLWRGPPLADFAYESFAQAAIARLEEIRLAAVELRLDANLALGRHDELVGELEALVAEQPLRERLRGYLMTALYGSGRQAEALVAYKDARRALVDELGIDPSPALQELERAILRHDPALHVEATASVGVREVAERSILVAITHEARVDALLAVAGPLVRHPPRVMILARLVSDAVELRSASAWLEERRAALETRGVVARAASFTSMAPGRELARLATELDVDLLLAEAPDELLADGAPDEQLTAVLAETPCDVALLVPRDASPASPRRGLAVRRGLIRQLLRFRVLGNPAPPRKRCCSLVRLGRSGDVRGRGGAQAGAVPVADAGRRSAGRRGNRRHGPWRRIRLPLRRRAACHARGGRVRCRGRRHRQTVPPRSAHHDERGGDDGRGGDPAGTLLRVGRGAHGPHRGRHLDRVRLPGAVRPPPRRRGPRRVCSSLAPNRPQR
jgi:DNA-binding SARP family transcriptional activator